MANFITIFRTLLGFVVVAMLFITTKQMYIAAFILTIIVIWMDGLDGYVARKLNETSKFGAVLDILSDRVVENVYWITFLALGWIPLWIPLVVVSRGIITDGLRSLALEQGFTAFGASTMMESPLGKFIVTSNFSRFSYAVFKAVSFAFLIFINIPNFEFANKELVTTLTYASVYITVFFCIVRGLPVILESKRFLK